MNASTPEHRPPHDRRRPLADAPVRVEELAGEPDEACTRCGATPETGLREGCSECEGVIGPIEERVAQSANADVRASILDEISVERNRQDAKWGGVPGHDRRDDHTYPAVLGEEYGEACQAWLQRDVTALREELVQTAAVAVAWIEELDNGGGLARV